MCTYSSFFPPHMSSPLCRFSIFVFLLFSPLLHENAGLHCLCCRALELRHLFLLFPGDPVKEIGKLLKKSQQVVKSKDFRRQIKEWWSLFFKCVRNVIENAVSISVTILQDRKIKKIQLYNIKVSSTTV